MHPIGQILNFDDQRKFQIRGTEYMLAPVHILDASKIDKYITCTLSDETKYAELSNLVKKVQIHHHTNTCGKKKGVVCVFNGSWAPSGKTRIVRFQEKIDEFIVQ